MQKFGSHFNHPVSVFIYLFFRKYLFILFKIFQNNIIISIIILLLFTSSHSVFGKIEIKETLTYRHFTVEDGLTAKTVYVMIQDRNGFIWFATDAGVFRYDGKIFKHYTMRDGLSDNDVLNMAEDSKGRIWFLTLSGKLSYWYQGTIYNEKQVNFLKNTFVGQLPTTFYEDGKGRIWIGCKTAGMIIIDDTVVTKMVLPPDFGEVVGPYVFEARDGSIRFLITNHMINLSTNDTILFNEDIYLFGRNESKKAVYFTTYKGIYFTDGFIVKKIMELKASLEDIRIINFVGADGYSWLCKYGNGVYQINDSIIVNHYLEKSSVLNVLKDREGNLWFSTIDDGVYMLSQNKSIVRNYNLSSGLSDDRVFSVTKDDNKSLWLGYSNGLVDRISGSKITRFDMRRSTDPIYLMIRNLKFKNDTIWCGDDAGLKYIYNDKVNYVLVNAKKLRKRPYTVKDLYMDRNGQIYTASHQNVQIVDKDHSGYYVRNLTDSLFRTFSLTKLNDEELLVSTLHGLVVFVPGKYTHPFFTDSVFNSIRTIHMEYDRDSLLLLATIDKGLFVVKGKKIIQHLTDTEGLTDNNCKRIHVTDHEIYLATANGVTILSKGKNQEWEVSKTITINDGILSNIVNDICVFDNDIYLATDKGLSVISESFQPSVQYKTRIIITEIVTDENQNPFDTSFSVSADIPRVIIRFAYPVFDQSNKTSYEYRLTGENYGKADWVQTTNTEVEFSSLLPGKYYFEIRPSNVNNIKSTIIRFEVLPKWWQTVWAKILFVLTLSLILFFVIRLRFRIQFERRLNEMKQRSLIESERSRIASDMHDDIGGDLTQISLWMNILRSYEMKENKIVQNLSGLSEEVLSKMGQIIWALDSMHNSSGDLFAFIREYFSKTLEPTEIKFEYTHIENIPELKVSSFQRRNIFLVLKELLNNSIKHSKAKMIGVNINIEGNILSIKYFDDGVGFEISNNFAGHGMNSMKRRIHELNGEINFESTQQKGILCNIRIII